jgi:carboxylesterase type B
MKHPGGTPHACPQDNLDAGAYAEDCLALLLYVPHGLPKDAPTLLWIHGGSFVEGSASDPGLDGAQLAAATRSIVAVAQYRLGGVRPVSPATHVSRC